MKAARTLAIAALSCAFPTSVEALSKVQTRNLDAIEDDAARGLMDVVSNILCFVCGSLLLNYYYYYCM